MDILKRLHKEADQVEVVELKSERTKVNFEANQLKNSQVEETQGVAVRLVKDGKLGFSASSDLTAIDKLVSNAISSSKYGDVIPLQFPKAQSAPEVTTYDDFIVELPIARMVEIGQEIIDHILAIEPNAQLNVEISRGVQQLQIRNQAGANISFQRSPLSIGAEIDQILGDDVLIMFDSIGTTIWDSDYMNSFKILGEKLKQARRITEIKSGHMPVLFSPAGSLVLGLPLIEGLNGKNVFTGVSPLIGKKGEMIFDEKFTFIDDATIHGKFGSSPYDDEGVPHSRNILIDHGVLTNFYYDLKTAALSGVQSTGNAERSLFTAPNPSLTNALIASGSSTLKEMISGIDEGLLVEDVLGLGQGNIISGAFSNPLSLAFKIEKGEIVGRVKNASVSGNVYDLLKNVGAVSRETQWVYDNLCMPYILLPDMNVISKD